MYKLSAAVVMQSTRPSLSGASAFLVQPMAESILHGDLPCFWLFASCCVPDIFVLVVCVSFAVADTCSHNSDENESEHPTTVLNGLDSRSYSESVQFTALQTHIIGYTACADPYSRPCCGL